MLSVAYELNRKGVKGSMGGGLGSGRGALVNSSAGPAAVSRGVGVAREPRGGLQVSHHEQVRYGGALCAVGEDQGKGRRDGRGRCSEGRVQRRTRQRERVQRLNQCEESHFPVLPLWSLVLGVKESPQEENQCLFLLFPSPSLSLKISLGSAPPPSAFLSADYTDAEHRAIGKVKPSAFQLTSCLSILQDHPDVLTVQLQLESRELILSLERNE